MKPGILMTRIMMFLLFLAIAAYFGSFLLQGMEHSVETAAAYTYTAERWLEASGFIIRSEQTIPAQTGMVDIVLSEGSTVAKGGVVAKVYADAYALEREAELDALAHEIEQLQYVTGRGDLSAGTAELNNGIVKAITSLKASVARGDLSGLEKDASELKNLVFRRDYTYNGETSLDQLLAEKRAAYDVLRQQTAQTTTIVRSPASGTFSSQVDGYESLFSPAILENLMPSDMDTLSLPVSVDGSWLGKIITESRWYFVCNLSEEDAKLLGSRAKLRFTTGYTNPLSMTVERVSAVENGMVTVVLSTNRYLANTTLLRRQTADLIYESAEGIRIPKRAVRLEEQTVTDPETGASSTVQQTGVYCVVGIEVEWKPITILWEWEDFYLVEPLLPEVKETKDEARALRAGDSVLVRGQNLYDGKTVGAVF